MRRFFTGFALLVAILIVLTSCKSANTRKPTTTAALGPPESALPYHAVFAVNADADERLISAAKNFCDRTVSLSNGGTVFNLVLSNDALTDLRAGTAELILLDNIRIPEFSIVSEAFRYKSYEHFSMTVNSNAALGRLSDILDANVFAGFYAGSNMILSRGTLDSKFRLARRNTESQEEPERIPVAALSSDTARAFSLLGADVVEENSLSARISAFKRNYFAVELSSSELDSPELLQIVTPEIIDTPDTEHVGSETILPDIGNSGESDSVIDMLGVIDETGETAEAEAIDKPGEFAETGKIEPIALTRAFTGIKPVWLVFAPSAYEQLSQTGRAVVAEATAYMTTDIDRVYLEYEREKAVRLLDGDVVSSREFTVTRTRALHLAEDAVSSLSVQTQKLRSAIARVR